MGMETVTKRQVGGGRKRSIQRSPHREKKQANPTRSWSDVEWGRGQEDSNFENDAQEDSSCLRLEIQTLYTRQSALHLFQISQEQEKRPRS